MRPQSKSQSVVCDRRGSNPFTCRYIRYSFISALLIVACPAEAGDCWSFINTSTHHVSQISSNEIIDFSWNNGNISRCSDIFWREGVSYRNCGGKLANHDATSFFDQTGSEWQAQWTAENKTCTCEKESVSDYKQTCTLILSGKVNGLDIPIRRESTETKVFRVVQPVF